MSADVRSEQEAVDTGHEYDGIREHDNKLPRWWLVTLWGAIVFAVGYWLVYQTFAVMPLPGAQFAAEMTALAARSSTIDDASLDALMKDVPTVERGRVLYAQTCLPCHGDRGQGVVGPNLTDDAWLHDDTPSAIWKVVSEGVLAKGMPAWKPALGPDKVRDVTAFVLTLRGQHLPGKAPEGVAKN